jgi:predicted  nucleic acid-binding Zn-ribbon protein
MAMNRFGLSWTRLALCFLVASLSGCVSRLSDKEIALGPEQADKLLVVDCLLPAQVRKLGEHFTYLAARQPIRTTAIDCEIRGGEYVAYDRANYATALKIWLPKAKEGDPQAQTYVGEIFEKGLGLKPDYQAALHWYRQAAEQGYAPAMINLGFLYEKGLGVPQDSVAALNWYRKASGLDKTDIAFAASVEVYNRKMEELEQEAAQYRQEAAGLKAQLVRLKEEQRKTLAALERARAEAATGRREAQRLRQKLETLPKQSSSQESSELKQRLEQQMAQLKEKEQKAAQLEQELARQNQQLATLKQGASQQVQAQASRIQQLEQELAQRDRDLATLRQKLAQTQAEAETLRQQLASGKNDLRAQLAELEAFKQQLAAKQAQGGSPPELAQLSAELKTKQAAIEALQQELSQRQKRLSELEGRLVSTEQQVQTKQAQLEALQGQIAAKEQSLQTLHRQLTEANARLAAQSQAVQALQQELAQKQLDHTVEQAELARLTAQIKEKQAEIERQQAHIQSLQAAVAEREQSKPAVQVARAEAASGEGPRIEIIDPPLRPQRGSLMVVTRGLVEARTVIGKVHAPAGILAFLVNDQDFIPEPDGTFKLKIPLKGKETPVHLAAIDKNSQRTELEFLIFQDIKTAAPVPKPESSEAKEEGKTLAALLPREIFGGYYALIIGNNAYRHLPVLDTPHNDAKALAKVLAERYGFKTQVLLDATRYDILKALNEYRKTLTEKDNFLIYYAGHGTLEKVTERGFWLPVDAELENTANWVSNQDITDLLRIMAAAHVMVIADSCYSGSLTRNSVARLEAGMTPEKKAEWVKLMLKAKSRMALTSGGLNPVLDSGGGGHSVFAKALVETLAKNQGILESFRLYTEVSALVADAARSENFHQVPEFSPIRHAGHEAGEFFFVPAGTAIQAGL